jgi:hypothetical protein
VSAKTRVASGAPAPGTPSALSTDTRPSSSPAIRGLRRLSFEFRRSGSS